jgi:hypothetical protein
MFRVTMIAALVVAGALATTAAAAKPIKSPVPPASLDFAAGDLCSFSVSIRTLETKQFAITFSNGTTTTHGQFVVSVTNDDTGLTRTFDLSGSVTFDALSPTLLLASSTGTSMAFFPTGAFGGSSPGSLILTHGRAVEIDDFSGPIPLVQSFAVLSGSSENLCNTMA